MDSSGLLHCVANDRNTLDCHDLQSKSRNDRMLDSSGNALFPSLRGEAEAIHKNDKKHIIQKTKKDKK